MDDANAHMPRVQNVTLRPIRSALSQRLGNPALPDDFAAIEKLLRIDRETLLKRLEIPEELIPSSRDASRGRASQSSSP